MNKYSFSLENEIIIKQSYEKQKQLQRLTYIKLTYWLICLDKQLK